MIIISKCLIFWIIEMLYFSTIIFELLVLGVLPGPWSFQLGLVEKDDYIMHIMYVCVYVYATYIWACVCVCNHALVLVIIAFDLPSLCYFIYRYIRWILSLSACIELCIKPGISSWLAGIETFVQKSFLKKWLRSVYHVFIRFVLSTFLWRYKPT